MIRFNRVVIVCALLLVMVTGCNNNDQADQAVVSTPMVVKKKAAKPKQAAPKPSASASPGDESTPASAGKAKTPATLANTSPAKKPKAATPAKAKAVAIVNEGAKPTLVKLKGYLPAAVKALQADDIAQAKQYAQDFNTNWKQKIIQYSVKNKSQAAYKKLAAGVAQVNNNLIKPATPDKAKAIAALQSLSQSMDEYTNSP